MCNSGARNRMPLVSKNTFTQNQIIKNNINFYQNTQNKQTIKQTKENKSEETWVRFLFKEGRGIIGLKGSIGPAYMDSFYLFII